MSPELHIVEFLAKGLHHYFSSALETVDGVGGEECDQVPRRVPVLTFVNLPWLFKGVFPLKVTYSEKPG